MSREEIKRKILEDLDFINSPSSENSVKKLLAKFPNGLTDEKIAQALMLDVAEVKDLYDDAIKKLRNSMLIEVEENEDE